MTVFRLSKDVKVLADEELGGRVPGTRGHEIAAEYIEARMREVCLEPLFGDSYGQPVPNLDMAPGINLCGVLPGRSGRKILIGAHYDHIQGIPGADDNAAAVAIALEAARSLHPWRGDAHLVFAFFDQEEPPYYCTPQMGSLVFAEHPPFELSTLECAVVMDLCGHDLPSEICPEGLIVMGAELRRGLLDTVLAADRPDLPLIPVPHALEPDQSDHLAFRERGVPFLFLSCGRWEHYHAPTDTVDRLNLGKMGHIAGSLVRMVRHLDGLPPGQLRTDEPTDEFFGAAARGFERLTGEAAPEDPAEMFAWALEWAERVGLR